MFQTIAISDKIVKISQFSIRPLCVHAVLIEWPEKVEEAIL